MSLRIAPPASHPTTHTHVSTSTSAPSAPGLHDTLRAGLGPIASSSQTSSTTSTTSQPTSSHPLESRLLSWTATQGTLKLTSLRRTFGIAEPVRRGMEIRIVREGCWKPSVLGGGEMSVSEEILKGVNEGCEWEDVFTENGRELGWKVGEGVNAEVERGVGMEKLL